MADENAVLVHESLRGFFVEKNSDGQWFIGRPKGSAIWWDECDLCDLLNLGLSRDDLEGVVVDLVYRAGVATKLTHTGSGLAFPA